MDVMVVEYVGQPDRFKLLPKANSQTATVAQNGSSVTGPSNMIICMEYCDAGEALRISHVAGFCPFRTLPAMSLASILWKRVDYN